MKIDNLHYEDSGVWKCIVYDQVRSLSRFILSRQLLKNDLNQVSSVSSVHDCLYGLANKGLFELTRRPSLTQVVLLSFAKTTKEPGCSKVKRPAKILSKFGQIFT